MKQIYFFQSLIPKHKQLVTVQVHVEHLTMQKILQSILLRRIEELSSAIHHVA
jgi:hypothetical protein